MKLDRAFFSTDCDPCVNLALEETLLERGSPDERLLLFYVNAPCIVVGRNQNPWAEVPPDVEWPLLRRVSGGGAVYQDLGNLNWAFILPRDLHDREAELGLVSSALRDLGIEVEPGPRGGLFVASGFHAGLKVSGTARRLSSARVLHHGTLLVEADLRALAASLGGIAFGRTRALASESSACVNLSTLVPGLGVEAVASALCGSIASRRPEGFCIDALEEQSERAYAEESTRRLGGWDWSFGATPPFSFSVAWSGGLVELEVRDGLLYSASGPGSELLSGLLGSRFDYGAPDRCLGSLEAGGVHGSFIPRG